MTDKELIEEIKSLPTAAKNQIERFIQRVKKSQAPSKEMKRPLRDEPFIGMWADREDMKDSTAWVRATRRAQFRHDR